MAGFTEYFNLAFFDVGDDFADAENVQLEMDRFTIIDRQLYGLYSVFGNGVVSGWAVKPPAKQSATNISVVITSGVGVINFTAAETTFQSTLFGLPPNSTVYVFAQYTGLTALTRKVAFLYSLSTGGVSNATLLAKVVTGSDGVSLIDNTVRTSIGYVSTINQAVAQHHHRGSPSKIDLATETKNQLPGSKIGELDAGQVTKGILDPARVSQLDHSSLLNHGQLSHDQLDALARKVSGNAEQLLGEIYLSNQLRDLLFNLTKDATYDKDWENTLALIPGVTNSSLIDFTNSTAHIDESHGCVSGLPVAGGQTVNVTWDTRPAFEANSYASNVVIDDTGVSIAHATVQEKLVEGFEDAGDSPLSSFTATLDQTGSSTGVTGSTSHHTQGSEGGDFTVDATFRVVFTKTLNPSQDWSDYDTLRMDVRCASLSHGPVHFYFEDASGTRSDSFQILDTDEVTSNADPEMDDFKTVNLTISAVTRSAVVRLVFFAEDVSNQSEFLVDAIRLRRSQQYMPQGTIRLRYGASDHVVFNSLGYAATTPTGTRVRARMKVADTLNALDAAIYSPYMASGQGFSSPGQYAEIEFTLLSDTNHSLTPLLTEAQLSLTAQSVTNGVTVQKLSEFSKGTAQNATIAASNADPDPTVTVRISTPLTVGDLSFLTHGAVAEIDADEVPLFSVTGGDLPVSEVQAYQSLSGTSTVGLSNPMSAVRTGDRRWVVCDTDNHRVLVFTADGRLQRGYCGRNVDMDTSNGSVIPLTATFNATTGILWLGFSKQVTIAAKNFGRIALHVGSETYYLAEEGLAMADESVTARVVGVSLTSAHATRLRSVASGVPTVTYDPAVTSGFDSSYASRAVSVYYAPVSYHDFIYLPVYADLKDDGSGRLWVANATVLAFVVDASGQAVAPQVPVTRNLQLFHPDYDTGIYTNNVGFSQEFGGAVLELADGTVTVAGIDSAYNGKVWTDSLGVSPQVLYQSPKNSQPTGLALDDQGIYWVSESSGTERAGRLLRLDSFGVIRNAISGPYTKINSVQVLSNGNLLIGT